MELEYRYNPFKWSEEYVLTHTNECSDDLLMLLDVSIKLVHENNLADAETGFMHVIYGLDRLSNVDPYFYNPFFYSNCFALAKIYAFGMDKREEALSHLRMASDRCLTCTKTDYPDYEKARRDHAVILQMLTDLENGMSLQEFKRLYSGDFPNDITMNGSTAKSSSSKEDAPHQKQRLGCLNMIVVGTLILIGIVFFIYNNFVAPNIGQSESPRTSVTSVTGQNNYSDVKYVRADGGLRLRSNPTTDSEKLLVIPDGAKITVKDYSGSWAYTTYNGISGWCSANYLKDASEETTTPTAPIQTEINKTMRVTADGGLRMRKEPSADGEKLTVIPKETIVKVTKETDGWAYVEYKGIEGWCSLQYLILDDADIDDAKIYTESDLIKGKEDAINVIRSFYGAPVKAGRSELSDSEAFELVKEGIFIESRWTCYGSMFDKLTEVKFDSYQYGPHYFVEDDRFSTLENLCDYYFSLYTDELAEKLILNNVILLDGKLTIKTTDSGWGDTDYTGEYTVEDISETKKMVSIPSSAMDGYAVVSDGVDENSVYIYYLILEDGIWVMESVEPEIN